MDEKIYCPHCGKELNIETLLDSVKSKRKAADKGSRPRVVSMDHFICNAMKGDKLFTLELVPMHVIESGENAKYRLIICHPDGWQENAAHQPDATDGFFPDIETLAEKNGFEPLDIKTFKDLKGRTEG
jgi:hypothetical protein